jgi:hypothetical protein
VTPCIGDDGLIESDARKTVNSGGHRRGEILSLDDVVQQIEPGDGHLGAVPVGRLGCLRYRQRDKDKQAGHKRK